MRYKSYITIFYLVIILFYLIRPLLPYIEYVVNRDYIEKNLCIQKDNPENTCHGKCHLHEKLNKQSEPQDADTNGNKKISPEKKIDDHLKGSQIIPELFGKGIVHADFYSSHDPVSYNSRIFIPPKYLSPRPNY